MTEVSSGDHLSAYTDSQGDTETYRIAREWVGITARSVLVQAADPLTLIGLFLYSQTINPELNEAKRVQAKEILRQTETLIRGLYALTEPGIDLKLKWSQGLSPYIDLEALQ